MASAKTTTDHETIKQWVEQRGGCPARVKGTGSNGDPGLLRIDYTGFSGVDTLEPIEWGEFFDAFEDNQLAFLYQDEPNSRFSKLVSRDGADQDQDQEGEEEEELEEDTLVIDAIRSEERRVGKGRRRRGAWERRDSNRALS